MQNTLLRWPPPRPERLTTAGDFAPPPIAAPEQVGVPARDKRQAAQESDALSHQQLNGGGRSGGELDYGEAVRRARDRARQSGTLRGQVSNLLDSWLGFETNPDHPANQRLPSPTRQPGPGSNAPAPDGPSLYFMMFRHGPQVPVRPHAFLVVYASQAWLIPSRRAGGAVAARG